MSTRTAPYNHQTSLALRTAGTIPVRYTTADEAATGRTHRGMPRTGDPRKLSVLETAIAEWPGGDSGIRITNLFEGARGIGDQRSVLSALANA